MGYSREHGPGFGGRVQPEMPLTDALIGTRGSRGLTAEHGRVLLC